MENIADLAFNRLFESAASNVFQTAEAEDFYQTYIEPIGAEDEGNDWEEFEEMSESFNRAIGQAQRKAFKLGAKAVFMLMNEN